MSPRLPVPFGKCRCLPEESRGSGKQAVPSSWFTPTHLRYLRTACGIRKSSYYVWRIRCSSSPFSCLFAPALRFVSFSALRFWAKERHLCLYSASSLEIFFFGATASQVAFQHLAARSAPRCARVPEPRGPVQAGLFENPEHVPGAAQTLKPRPWGTTSLTELSAILPVCKTQFISSCLCLCPPISSRQC